MAEIPTTWSHPQSSTHIDPNEKLFLFGYSCKIFPYDEKAAYIDQGQHLIPWMGDKTLMIDRYDVRGYLHDLKQYEPKSGGYDHSSEEEKLIDEERYRSLRTDMTEEQLYQEEELKRLRAAIAGDGAYHEIGFTYENPEAEEESDKTVKVEDPEDDLYQMPEGLKVPKGMEVPYNMKIHAIIEKTANFISEQGGQMEIIIKMKQHANPQFAFMHLDNPLHPYYKHLVKEIKSGVYKPIQARKGYDTSLVQRVSRSEDEDDDGHYLHPSLMAGKSNAVPKFTVPTINFRRSQDDSYSLLVKNLQQHLVEETPQETAQQEVFEQNAEGYAANNLPAEYYNEDGTLNELGNNYILQCHHIVPPPPDVQPIVDKMAEYVAKNGEDFETIVKSKKDKRFDFLNPGNEYYNYYVYKRDSVKYQMYGNGSASDSNAINTNVPHSTIQNSELPEKLQNDIPFISSENDSNNPNSNTPSVVTNTNAVTKITDYEDEYDALYGQDSQENTPIDGVNQDSSDSLDFLNSPSDGKERYKSSKVMKGPISFSLKAKESETPSEKAKLTPLGLDDSDEDGSEEGKTNKEESSKQKNSTNEQLSNHNSKPAEVEVKVPKQNSEAMEAKLAEERIRDKLLATARERLAQQRKEKQLILEQQQRAEQLRKDKLLLIDQQRKEKELQLERKRKAALFLKMLKRRSPDSTPAVPAILKSSKKHDSQDKKASRHSPDFWSLPDTSDATSPESGILFPLDKIIISTQDPTSSVIPGIKTDWSPDTFLEESVVPDAASRVMDKQSSDSDSNKNTLAKEERKRKKKKRSRSRSKDRSRSDRSSKSSRRMKDRHRSKSPPKHYKEDRSKREKKLPAAYANINRSRSRSRSPRRYRSIPNWRRR